METRSIPNVPSKEALVREACDLSFNQALKSWLAAAKKEDGESGSKVEAIVRHYFKARPADQICPMLAYAPDVSAQGTSSPTREAYSRGAEALFDLFAEDDPGSDAKHDASVLFAAMIGAQLLVQATDGSEWSRLLRANVSERATEIALGRPGAMRGT